MLGSGAKAEDVVHDCFATFAAKDRSDVTNPRAYLRQMVVHECLRVQRRHGQESLFRDPPDGAAEADHSNVELYESLARLTPRRRAAIVLRYVDDLAVTEIAEILECTPTTVSSLIHRALADLRSTP